MNILRRWLGLHRMNSPEAEEKSQTTVATLERERQDLRQSVQKLESGTRLMRSWAEANHMLQRGQE